MTDNGAGNAETFNFDCKLFNGKEVIGKLLMNTNIRQTLFIVNRIQFLSELSFILPIERPFSSVIEFGTPH